MEPEGIVSPIGSGLLARAPMSTEHPLYKSITSRASETLNAIARREGTRQRGKRKLISFESLTAEDSETLKVGFPEFCLVDFGVSKPGHSLLAAYKNLSTEWCVEQCWRHTSNILHIGGVSINHVLGGRRKVELVGDEFDPDYTHRKHENVLNLVRSARESATISAMLERPVDVDLIMDALKGKAYVGGQEKSSQTNCRDAVVFDGLSTAIGPKQLAGTMAEYNSRVCYGFIPYTPNMLVADEGDFGDTGVYYRKVRRRGIDVFQFVQSNGRVMIEEMPVIMWSQWVSGHVVKVKWQGSWKFYQYELLLNRGCVMFFKFTQIDNIKSGGYLCHALDLPFNAELYVVNSWRLKSVVADTDRASNWTPVTFTVDVRLAERVYAFAMQTDKQSFTRFSIRKQLKVCNDRVVVQGTGVQWHAPLTPDQMDDLSVALFARAFVDRYDAGNLSSELMHGLKTFTNFGKGSKIHKIKVVAGLCLQGFWDCSFGKLDEWVRRVCDRINSLVNSGRARVEIGLTRAPTYVLMSEVGRGWMERFAELAGTDIDNWLPGFNSNLPGYFSSINTKLSEPDSGISEERVCKAKVPGSIIVSHTDYNDGEVLGRVTTDVKGETMALMKMLNEFDYEPVDRHVDLSQPVRRTEPTLPSKPDFDYDADPIYTLNDVYQSVFPGNNLTNSEYDVASNVYDPQARNFSAKYLRMGHRGEGPKPKQYYVSKIKAINVPKRQETLAELISATSARNMDPPVLAKPQSYETIIPDVWETFKRKACRPDVDVLLAKYQADPVAMGEDAFADWMEKSKDESVMTRISALMNEHCKAVEEYDVGSYVAMNKADVKVPLSDKAQQERIEPQVIVYHDKVLSAGFSTIFRVLVGRFLSLLLPNVHINLRKDSKDIAAFINSNHPYHEVDNGLKPIYLENDFSKYDKSQLELVFTLEKFIFEQLGMNRTFVDSWFRGHVDCRIRSFVHAFSLHVSWQRKSGDATTSFGNVILNSMSVMYAYPMSEIYWMVFMGDDSIVCTRQIAAYDGAVKILAEVFNLQAKTYVTSAPYFASNFIVINQKEHTTALLPDPIKRIERWSMSVSELEDTWDEKYISAADVCSFYKYKMYTAPLSELIVQRYPNLNQHAAERMCSAIANLTSSKKSFRAIWEDKLTLSLY